MINYVSVEIGGQEIDKHYGAWMYVWQELTMTSEKAAGYKSMVGGTDAVGPLSTPVAEVDQVLHVPLDFWFNVNAGLALPLIALQYHEVKFIFQFNALDKLLMVLDSSNDVVPKSEYTFSGTAPVPTIDLFIDYIYLDTDERRRFAQMSHEYLIEQVQHNETTVTVSSAGTVSQRLTFNHPCKELIWFFQGESNTLGNDMFNLSDSAVGDEENGTDVLSSAVLRLNGHYRFNPKRGPQFFRQWQPFIHHTNIPSSNIYVYSFALRPEEHQPSGSCNFSRIDNTILEFEHKACANFTSATLTVFARNYNVLRIMSGMGGLAYSN